MVEYLKTPPSRALLVELIDGAGITPGELLGGKGAPRADLGLGDPALSDDALADAIMAHPVLTNRPLVVSPGVKLCRPSEALLDLLQSPQQGSFSKEDGNGVVDESGARVARCCSRSLNDDLLAKRWVPYSYMYPFAEGGAGVLMIAGALTSCRYRSRCSSARSGRCRCSRPSMSTSAS